MDTFFLEILSPVRVFYSAECLSLMLPVSDGMMGIKAHHTPLTAAISDGELRFLKPDGEWVSCAVTRGMIDVSEARVRILCDSALSPDEIDADRERRHLEEARLKLQKTQSQKDFKMWQLSFNKAVNRLKVKDKGSRSLNI